MSEVPLQVATISANGEVEVGKLLAEAMERVSECVYVCVRESERECVFECVCVCVRERV